MSCEVVHPSFRLLDGTAGWDAASAVGISGFDGADDIRLAPDRPFVGAVHYSTVERCIMPGWLARSADGTWWLATDGVRRLAACDDAFRDVDVPGLSDTRWATVTAVAACDGLVVVAERTGGTVIVTDAIASRRIASAPVRSSFGLDPTAVAVAPGPTLLVGGTNGRVIEVSVSAQLLREWALPTDEPVVAFGALGAAGERRPVAVTDAGHGWRRVWALDSSDTSTSFHCDAELECASDLDSASCETDVTTWAADDGRAAGFCINEGRRCFDRQGEIWSGDETPSVAVPRSTEGTFEPELLDSGVERCNWHRVRVDADIPPTTDVQIEVCTLSTPDEQINVDDWQSLPPATDALIRQQPGRYLRLRLRLRGNGTNTPVVRQVRIDFEHASTLSALPSVYRTDPEAADFTARLLALFEAVHEGIDDLVASAPLLFVADALPDELLPVLAGAVGIDVDASWSPDRIRRLIRAVPRLYSRRGTASALVELVGSAYGLKVLVEEVGATRPWGMLGDARLREVRLQSRRRRAVQLGASALGAAPIDRFADLDTGAFESGAYRCVVSVPSVPAIDDVGRQALGRLVRSWVPAHLETTVRFASSSLVLGPPVRLGLDTALGKLPATVLRGRGVRGCRLHRSSVLGRARGRGGRPLAVGTRASVGIDTTLE